MKIETTFLKNGIYEEIKKYRNWMPYYAKEAQYLIENWELTKALQEKKDQFNKTLPPTTAIYAFRTIQFSLIFMSWLSLMKLWDSKIKQHDKDNPPNVRLANIYSFVKNSQYKIFLQEKYHNDPFTIETFSEKAKRFKILYDKYTNGKSKSIYKELKRIRNEHLAHTQIGSILCHDHSLSDLDLFYNDTIQMVEDAHYFFNISILFKEHQDNVRRNAYSLISVMLNYRT